MASLYTAEEIGDVRGFFRAKFNTDTPPPGHENIWRLELIRHFTESFVFAAANFFYVADKEGNLVLLKPFVGQAVLDVTIDAQLRAGLPGRIAEVKPRQVGWTVRNIARGLHYCLNQNRRALLLVDDENVANEQALRLGTMLNGLPGFLQPMRRIQNLTQLFFDNPNPKERMANPGLNSSFQITVPSSMRGVPQGFVCISEYAHMTFERQAMVQEGVISAAPLTPSSIIVIDTTPNGQDESYWPMVMEACEDNPKWVRRMENWRGELTAQQVYDGALGTPDAVEKRYSGVYVPAFAPWRIHPEYTCRSKETPQGELPPLRAAQRAEMQATLGNISKYGGEEERDLRDRYDLSLERLFWRRRKIDGYKYPTDDMKLMMFRQEFLSDINSAFINSGHTPFDRSCIDAVGRQVREPKVRGLFRSEGEFDHHARNSWQEIRIYFGPQPGEKYTIGIDTDVAYENPDSDASVAQVVRFSDNAIVATYEARVSAAELCKQIYALYRLYNNPYYAVETKGMGFQVMRQLYDMRMTNAYMWKKFDQDIPVATSYLGWDTNGKTRPIMDQTITELICRRNPETGNPDPDILIPDAKTYKELLGLTRQPSGAFKNPNGKDDHYDALCIALCIARDPWSGLRRLQAEDHERKQREFESRFLRINSVGIDRNRPDIATL